MAAEVTFAQHARAALQQVDELVERLVPVIVAAEPPGFYDDEAVEDLRSAVRASLASLLAVLGGQTASASEALEVARATGRRQVQQALPLEGVLRGYRLAGRVVWDHLVAQARSSATDVGPALLDGASELWDVIDRFSAAVAEAYRAEEGHLRERDERLQAAVLTALLEGRGSEPQFARDATHALGLAIGGPWVCVVALSDAPDVPALDAPRDRLRAAGFVSAWTTASGADVGIVGLGKRDARSVRELLSSTVRGRAGLSGVFTGLGEVPRARHLAETAARCPGPRGTVRVLEEDLVAGLVVEAPLVASMLHERTIGALLAADPQDGPALLDTLRLFLGEDGSLNAAATKGFVHRNTLLYRLNKVEKLTGTSPRTLQDQVLWVLALKEHDARGS